MAEWNHIQKLLEGVESWNRWRVENPEIKPDLSGLRYSWKDLSGVDLNGADLSRAELHHVTLTNANLTRSNLTRAVLQEAILNGADLSGAFLWITDLRGADLTRAIIHEARFKLTLLRGAIVEEGQLTFLKPGAGLFSEHDVKAFAFPPGTYKGDPDQITMLVDSVSDWNIWRKKNSDITPRLMSANLAELNLDGADLSGADLRWSNWEGTTLRKTNLWAANLEGASLPGCDASGADMRYARLIGADLRHATLVDTILHYSSLNGAKLQHATMNGVYMQQAVLEGAVLDGAQLPEARMSKANLAGASFVSANLQGADLKGALLVGTDFTRADLSGCQVYGVSAWDVVIDETIQKNLIVSENNTPVRVDNLEVAQFIYMLLSRQKLRSVLTTLGEKAVLILGRFTERKELLERMAERLRWHGYLPVIFDFERPTDRDITETVKVLAGISLFVVADITSPRSIPLELQATVPDYMVPFVTLLRSDEKPFSMFEDLKKYSWLLPLVEYPDTDFLMDNFDEVVVERALGKVDEVRALKASTPVRLTLKKPVSLPPTG